jgi:signal transduction histidine kinase
MKKLNPKNLDEATKKYIKIISLEASKINSIANFITKANFNLKASEIETDLVDFIIDYLNEVYIHEDAIIDTRLRIETQANGASFVKTIRPLEITAVLDNFISNAEKAINSINPILSISFKVVNSQLVIKIADNGKGIKQEVLGEIFDLGYTTTDGSGIGLFQVHDIIVNKMKGEIKVDSELNKGTTFTLTIP